MRYRAIFVILFASCILALFPLGTAAQSSVTVSNNQAIAKFPESITFNVDLKSESEINRVVLEYGVQQLTCGTVVGKAFPTITPSKQVNARWTWEMKQSGSQPPGATIWWRWRITYSDGKEIVSEQKTMTWLDDSRKWQTLSEKDVTLHWYAGDKIFAAEVQNAGLKALTDLSAFAGLQPDGSIDLYVYATTQDLRDSILYTPGWTGGRAYPAHNIVAIGIPTTQLEWGKRTVAHELTHVLFGRYTFTCLGQIPVWLNEGIAMFAEGGPDANSQKQFQTAVANDKLISVRALTSSFSEAADQADLSYTESYSLVNFLINESGQAKLMSLLRTLRDGMPIEPALRSIYGFDSDGLEDVWRAKIGAKPRVALARTSATATPTIIPTLVPIAGLQIPTRTSTPIPSTTTATTAATLTAIPMPSTPTPLPRVESATTAGDLNLPIIGIVVVIILAFSVFALLRRQKG